MAVTLENARGLRTEPGNLRFDVLLGADDPNFFQLYEVYRDKGMLAAHRETPHFPLCHQGGQKWLVKPSAHEPFWSQLLRRGCSGIS